MDASIAQVAMGLTDAPKELVERARDAAVASALPPESSIGGAIAAVLEAIDKSADDPMTLAELRESVARGPAFTWRRDE